MCTALCLPTTGYTDMAARVMTEAKKRCPVELLKLPALWVAIKRPASLTQSSKISSLSQIEEDDHMDIDLSGIEIPTIFQNTVLDYCMLDWTFRTLELQYI